MTSSHIKLVRGAVTKPKLIVVNTESYEYRYNYNNSLHVKHLLSRTIDKLTYLSKVQVSLVTWAKTPYLRWVWILLLAQAAVGWLVT